MIKISKSKIVKILLIALINISIIIGIFLVDIYLLPNFKSENFQDYFGFSKNNIQIVKDNVYIKTNEPPIISEGNLYVSFDFVQQYVDQYIFWDDNLKKLTITTSDKVIRFTADKTTYYVNSAPMTMNIPVYLYNGKPYIPKSLLENLYDFTFDLKSTTNILIVTDNKNSYNSSKIIKKTSTMRFEPDKKAFIETKLNMGDSVIVYETGDKYTKVRSSDGLIGYIKNTDLGTLTKTDGKVSPPLYRTTPISGKIDMIWNQLTTVESSKTKAARTVPFGVNVISPTWFKFDRTSLNGDIITIADKDYVDWAHKNKMQVWGLISDVSDVFDSKISHAVLTNTDYREHAIKQLLAYTSMYNLDGINIDFEAIDKKDASSYLQFFRELYPYMKAENKVLSVDMYVPTSWSEYYNRTEIAKTADYICVMAYDEHTSLSKEIGAVATLPFVENGLKDTIAEVPKDQVILGVPFYTRIWKSQVIKGALTEKYYGDYAMDSAYTKFKTNKATINWDDATGYDYGEYTVTEKSIKTTYKAWLESLKSIEQKLMLYQKYDVKGVAGWKKDLDGKGVMELISKYVNK